MGGARRIHVGILAILSSLFLAGAAGAQSDAPRSPILTINLEQLYTVSHYAERVESDFAAQKTALEQENRRKETELEDEEKALAERRKDIAAAEFRVLADAFDEKVQRIRLEQHEKEQGVRKDYEDAKQDFVRLAAPILRKIVTERGALLLLDGRSVLAAADSIDITDEAISRINAELGSGQPQDPLPEE